MQTVLLQKNRICANILIIILMTKPTRVTLYSFTDLSSEYATQPPHRDTALQTISLAPGFVFSTKRFRGTDDKGYTSQSLSTRKKTIQLYSRCCNHGEPQELICSNCILGHPVGVWPLLGRGEDLKAIHPYSTYTKKPYSHTPSLVNNNNKVQLYLTSIIFQSIYILN